MRVLLHDNQICERGTTTSMLDYARALRGRGHDVELSYWSESPANVPTVIERVRTEFPLHGHKDPNRLPDSFNGFDSAYFIKAGYVDGLVLPDVHTLIHAVFKDYEPHGSRYAYISQWLADHVRSNSLSRKGRRNGILDRGKQAQLEGCKNALEFDHLDLIVDIAEPQSGMRDHLGIPEDAFVITRFGGYDSFDISWVHQTVIDLLNSNSGWYFVGLNTAQFTNHERAIFLPMTPDSVEKASIAGAADVFLSARGEGEAFGVALAEALQLGLPVLAWEGGAYQNQRVMLRGLDGLYRSSRDLRRKLSDLAHGGDAVSREHRLARGNRFRPRVISPRLEQLLQRGMSSSEDQA